MAKAPMARHNRHRLRAQGLGNVRPDVAAADPTVPLPVLTHLVRNQQPLIDSREAAVQAQDVRASSNGLGIVDRLLATPDVSEIMINGVGQVWVEHHGQLVPVKHRLSTNGLSLIIERMLGPLGLRLDRLNPIVDARLPDGSRVNVVGRPLAIDGPVVCIRRFAPDLLPLDAFGPAGLVELLRNLVVARRSILVVGPTSSGKTTLLNSLSRHVSPGDRVVTIEDTAELQLAGKHVVRLESRRSNSEGVGEVSLRRLVTTALRLRPDRLIVGEVRGAEALDLLLALTSGHTGSFSTCHAADAASGLRRLQMLAALADAGLSPELLHQYVIDAIDVVVTVSRFGRKRSVTSVDEVVPSKVMTPSSGGLRRLWTAPDPSLAAGTQPC